MKKILSLIIIATVILASCEGPEGPPGFDGQDGVNVVGQTYEVSNVNYTYNANDNLWSTVVTFPQDIVVLESDAVLVYRFDGTVPLDDGSTANAWSQIPQNFFTNQGTIQYVFAHTFIDVELFIDGNYPLGNLDTSFTDNQEFRFVIIPSDFAATLDVTNLSAVMNALNQDFENPNEGLEN